jgi:hypothetical protein
MAYLGNNNLPFDPMRTAAEPRDAERFSGNGSLTTFTLSRFVQKAVDLEVFVENVQQEPIVAYDVNGTSLIFTEAVPTGSSNIYVIYRKFDSGAQVYLPDGSVSYNKLANNIRLFTVDNYIGNTAISTYALSEAPADANTLSVSVDGIVQRAPLNYTISGQTITFTSAPPSGSNVHIKHLGFRSSSVITAIPAGTSLVQPNISNPTITLAAENSSFKGNVSLFNSAGTSQVGRFGATSAGQVQLDVGANTLSVRASTIALANVTSFSVANTTGVNSISIDSLNRVTMPSQPVLAGRLFTAQTVATATNAVVNWDQNFVNQGSSGISYSAGRFTAQVAGVFFVHGKIRIQDSTGGFSVEFMLKKNGTYVVYDYHQSIAGYEALSLSTYVSLSVNDYLEFVAWQSAGTSKQLTGSAEGACNYSIKLVA